MFCKFCGKEVSADVTFCPNCGKKIGETADNRGPNQYQQSNHNNQQYTNQQYTNQQYNNQPYGNQGYANADPGFNQNSTGLNILGFFLPIVGLILYCVYEGTEPVKAKNIGKWSLIGFGIGVASSILFYACAAATVLTYY